MGDELRREKATSMTHEHLAIQAVDLCANTLTLPGWSEMEIEVSPAKELPEGTWLVEGQIRTKHPLSRSTFTESDLQHLNLPNSDNESQQGGCGRVWRQQSGSSQSNQ